jgi:hypothetical protein
MELEISTQVSLGVQGPDVALVQAALEALGRNLPAAEADTQVLGPGTAAVLKAVQADLGVPATGVVDAATVRVINAALGARPTAPRTVRGQVRTADGRPAAGLSVSLYLQGPNGETVAGKSSLDQDGAYRIAYQPPPALGRVDLRIEVRDATAAVETAPPGTSILPDADAVEVVDFVLSGDAHPPSSEYDLLVAQLKPLLGSRDPAKLADGAQVSLLALQNGNTLGQVAALATASRIAATTRMPTAVLYGLLRQGLPADLASLQATHPDVLRTALDGAVAAGIVPKAVDGQSIGTYLSGLRPQADDGLKTLLGRLLQPAEVDHFLDVYQQGGADPADAWAAVASDSSLGPRAAALKLTVQLAALTGNHAPLVGAIVARPGVKQASDLVSLSKDDWLALVMANGVPGGTPGTTLEERASTYVGELMTRVEAAFPTPYFAARLGDTPVGRFLQANPDYDFGKTYPALFFKQNPAAAGLLDAGQQRQLQDFQRVYRLTGQASETLALAAKGIGSAQQVSRLSRQAFIDQQQGALEADRASAIYDRALQVSAMALAVYGENAAAMNRTGLRVLPRLDSARQAAAAAGNPIPDWATLFGSPDSCACLDCASVHGAPAYFVDALHFLDERGVLPALLARRPDLGEIELSCQNTDTTLPVVDLVNEILEAVVAPPGPFAPFQLAASLEADLGQPVASDALSAAFTPPLAAGTQVEVTEAGARWRIWDELFAYTVIKQGGMLSVATRSRQTAGSADERRATPQYRDSAAYQALSQAVYPWSLPFDLSGAEANVFLAHLGVSRRDLIEALGAMPEPYDPAAPIVVRLAAEGLGLSDAERRILAGEPLSPPQPPEAFWNGAHAADLPTLRALLDRSGLGFADVQAVLATRFVNPGSAVTIAPQPGAADACDTATLQVNGLTDVILNRLHVFVRLWRKLGWDITDVDRAVCTLAADANAPAITSTLLVRIDHLNRVIAQLHITVRQALALWMPIDTAAPGSLYEALFYNPTVFSPQEEAFRLRPDGQELAHAGEPIAGHVAALQAAFRLGAAPLALLLPKTDGTLSLASLSVIHRHALLAQQLGLTTENLLTAIDLTGIDPFDPAHTENTLRFVATVAAIQRSAFDLPRLDYLLRQRFSPAAPFVPTDDSLAVVLGDIRGALAKATDADLQRSAVIDRVSAAIGLPADVTSQLLDMVVHGGETARQRFLELSAITAEPIARNVAQPQFETLEKLMKIASIVQALQLPGTRLGWLLRENPWLRTAPDPQPASFAGWSSLLQLDRVRQDLSLQAGAVEGILGALDAVAAATGHPAQATAKQAFVDALATWLDWVPADLESLIGQADDPGDPGLLAVTFPDSYRAELLVRLSRAVPLLRRLGITPAQAAQWCGASVTADDAKAIRGAAKSKYDAATWPTIVTPLQDSLRDRQREALVGYLAARPSAWTTGLQTAQPDDLYAHFLIDVQMSACQLTSRMVQAIGSAQLFAQRCLMGLESGVQASDPAWQRWDAWMKNYRVWEANREIWLYPENWIEPELRDDKTPFFTDLESELQQSDLDNTAAEQALMHYLEKLDQVSRLEVAGTYQDTDGTVHVFGRSFHPPHVYFYRRRSGTTQAWTPWEQVVLDIEGDHLIPVVWNGTLMLIWPIFSEKQDPSPVTMPGPHETLASPSHYWDIQLAWSEYQYGRWSAKSISDPVSLTANEGWPDILFGDYVPAPGAVMLMKNDGAGGGPVGGGIGPGGTAGGSTGAATSSGPTAAPPVPLDMMIFKAWTSGDTLTVRGYLRLDYAGGGAGAAVAYPFGEFRFAGCRKIVTTAHRGQLPSPTFALAPQGTAFDAMWLDETGAGLTMLDGTFASGPVVLPPVTILNNPNEPAPLPQDASAILARAISIPVLGSAASPYRLLAPHQDPQFTGNRPFFYGDWQRAFVVSSTGSSGFIIRPGAWAAGELATVGMASAPSPAPPGDGSPPGLNGETSGLTVLVRGPGGTRLARMLPAVQLNVSAPAPKAFTRFWSDRAYTFQNFHHPYVCALVESLEQGGIDAVLTLDNQQRRQDDAFQAYQPTARVVQPYPVDEVEFQLNAAYATYNWELFFHVPFLIAARLSANQRFADAQRWFHYIFHPAGVSGGEVPQAYWRTLPFYSRAASDYEQQSVANLEQLAAGNDPSLQTAVSVWRDNPFDPFAVARLRTTAFQKAVVMKYLDNLIAWGDQLFRSDTIESINEATQLYVLAAAILGDRPEVSPPTSAPAVQTFNSLTPLGLLSNALVQVELLIPDSGGAPAGDGTSVVDPPKTPYFCVQANDRLLGYWDTVADRLFKIRHCMNIEGQVRQLPLFEPPIDPALLVRARAAGLSLADVLSDVTASLPNYRFAVMLQKAGELAAEVRNLGAALLSVLEKNDAEGLATLRSGQELQLLQATRDVRARQVDEADANAAALRKSQEMAQARADYYASREFMNADESASQALTSATVGLITQGGALRFLAGQFASLGTVKLGAPTTAGAEVGWDFAARAIEADAGALDATASVLGVRAQLAARLGEYHRRRDEWTFQADLAAREVKQIEQQVAAAQIRLDIAQRELANHDLQIDNARAADAFLRGKYTSQDLYQWMIGQVSGVYFQSYQLAYDLAKRAELCLQHELGLAYGATSFVRFGYWDSLRKGLLAGESLTRDLKRLDAAYLDGNIREYELTKHVSLASLAPEQLIALKETGTCQFDVPEWLFDLDTPGHYMRRIRMANVTIPCVIGPYTTIHCRAQLVKSAYRQNATLLPGTHGYDRLAADDPGAPDGRFIDDRKVLEAMVTSTAQNDAGLFEPSLRDERYLPFEGAGAISTWRLDLSRQFRTLDYDSITDVILHLRYTARDGGQALSDAAEASTAQLLADAARHPLSRLFSLRHEFPTEWNRFVNTPAAPVNAMTVDLAAARFPYFALGTGHHHSGGEGAGPVAARPVGHLRDRAGIDAAGPREH